ncbi:10809_t:CDS:2 [Funneliformis mosseae]|uniref:10809_t:CDS:1 n=1 Tax=Funneliformis mosseae TaxID=27381 RepID=A0A9N8ZIP3_FUNMO|nr:10809_t:CDS:2 [Funneliformis mosseae]
MTALLYSSFLHLIVQRIFEMLSRSDLDAHEYLHLEKEIPEGKLTDREIINVILNEEKHMTDEDKSIPILEKVSLTEVENAADKMMRFLYEQEPKFGEVNKKLKVLKRLHK